MGADAVSLPVGALPVFLPSTPRMHHFTASHTAVVFLKPGEIYFSSRPAVVKSVLGSCVAITLYDPNRKLGAMCHAMLPDSGGLRDDFRFVDCAVPHMYRKMIEAGCTDMIVKLFGGAQVLDPRGYDSWRPAVGEQNVASAETTLTSLGLKISARDTGGFQGRKIRFCTRRGDVLLKRMRQIHVDGWGG